MNRAFKGVWIPSEIWLSKKISLQEKAFLAEIDSLDNEKGCYASNKYFADFFDLSRNRCSEIIKSLEAKEFITITYIRDEGKMSIKKRVVRVVGGSSRGVRNVDRPVRNVEEGCSEKGEENSTSTNNTFNSKDHAPKIKELLSVFSTIPNFTEMNKKYWDAIRETRVTKKVAESVIYRNMNAWKKYDPIVVEYALKAHIDDHVGKKEEYTIGIMRNTTKEEAQGRLNNPINTKGAVDINEFDLDD